MSEEFVEIIAAGMKYGAGRVVYGPKWARGLGFEWIFNGMFDEISFDMCAPELFCVAMMF